MKQMKDFLDRANHIVAEKWWLIALVFVLFVFGSAWIIVREGQGASQPAVEATLPALSGVASSQIIATAEAAPIASAPEQAPARFWDWTTLLIAILSIVLVVSLGMLIYLVLQSYGWVPSFRSSQSLGATTTAVSTIDTTPYLSLLKQPEQRFAIHTLPFAIGRAAENELAIDDSFDDWESVSRLHARIGQQQLGPESYYVIEDLASQNGTWIDGGLTPKNLLQDGMRIGVGKVTFVFHMGEAA